ncbi:MAG: hypothetical protein ABFD25_03355 [Clostridiaceae bacterium]
MNIESVLTLVLAVAIAIERLVEVIKPLYLKIKNYFGKYIECSKTEKIIMSVLVGPTLCIISGIGIDIPGIAEPVIVRAILTGLFASIGSNVIHTLLSLVVAFKDAAEGIK